MKLKINTQLILDLSVTGLFILLSMIGLTFIFPKGATVDFLERGSFLVGLGVVVICVIFLFFWFFNKSFKIKKKIEFPQLKDFILLILPMTPVIGYIVINKEYLNILGLIYLIFIPLIFSLVLSFIIPILLSFFASFKMLMISGLSLSFTILSMPEITQDPSGHFFNSQFITQGSYLIFSFIFLYFLYFLNKKITYVTLSVFFLSGVAQSFFVNFDFKSSSISKSDNRLESFLDDNKNTIIEKKDIFILVYESYANQEMLSNYGFDNSKQIKFLEDNNFKIYNGIYSNAAQSIASTSRILEVRGELPYHGRYYTSGNAFGLEIFKANEYKTTGLFTSPFFFSQYPITWDEYYPKGDVTKMGGKTILKGIYEGEFRFDIFDDDHNYEKYLELKRKLLSFKSKEPRLFYTHNKYPGHSGNSGKCHAREKQKYFEGMQKANDEMRIDIENLVKNNSNSIIVITSDHGPYLTKNCFNLRGYDKNLINKYDIQDRYGVFLAIHWPKNLKTNNYNVQISQDIFPAILGNITHNDSLFEKLKVERKFFDRFNNNTGGVNVHNGIVKGGQDDGKPLFDKRSYKLKE